MHERRPHCAGYVNESQLPSVAPGACRDAVNVVNRTVAVRPPPLIDDLLNPATSSIWIFGYGSLIYRPGFSYRRRVEGYIEGFHRVWWQASTDHRGTPEAPGRTVTLEAAAGARTWGVAWELDGDLDTQLATLQYLEVREKQYDVRQLVEVWGRPGQLDAPASLPPPPSTQPPFTPNAPSPMDTLMPATSGQVTQPAEHGLLLQRALCYIASPANPNWLGPTTHAQLVAQVSTACGPSGPNYEYVTRLAAAMRLMGVDDPELFRLEADLRLTCPAAAAAPPT
ncbi:ChaC-like protein-domain-containing protein [Haematococcus lacustris]